MADEEFIDKGLRKFFAAGHINLSPSFKAGDKAKYYIYTLKPAEQEICGTIVKDNGDGMFEFAPDRTPDKTESIEGKYLFPY